MRYVIAIVVIALFLIWNGMYNGGRYAEAGVRSLNSIVRYVTG